MYEVSVGFSDIQSSTGVTGTCQIRLYVNGAQQSPLTIAMNPTTLGITTPSSASCVGLYSATAGDVLAIVAEVGGQTGTMGWGDGYFTVTRIA